MSPIAMAAVLAIVLPAAYLVWSVIATDRTTRKAIEINLGLAQAGSKQTTWTIPERLQELARRITPKGYAAFLDKRLAAAGRPGSWPLDRVLVLKPILALVGLGFGLFILKSSFSPLLVLFTIAACVLCYFLPDLLLQSAGQKRRESMQRSMPNMLDQMLISVEAGVGFEAAMARAAENSTGPLAEEFIRTLQDIQVGRARREAYLALGERASSPDLGSFIRAVVQADQYGIAIAKVLRAQAKEMRTKRRQRAEEQAMKIPVKIIFPLMLTILPALFIVVMGPAVMNIVKMFS
ncbi:tight adherence protein C [Sinomonas atrocyanea]|uniref:type II secretion system F family protein n=1 Tax=Sinomonas atrocyanea TaxID=37927 RepID=UPI0027859EA7|nr:type II secretion system F family protein [Sinomonas atrocyanea]MDQ0258732.1 tight adherence protein C [Sinomonas atrocyanea]